MAAIGIPAALIAAFLLSLGTEFQERGVAGTESEREGLSRMAGIRRLLASRRWLLGSGLFVLSYVLQIGALLLAPLPVVQPIGALAIVAAAILDVRMNQVRLTAAAVRAIALSIAGVALFVIVAAFTTASPQATPGRLVAVLIVTAAIVVGFAVLVVTRRDRIAPLAYAVGAGACFGLVVTLAKVLLDRIESLIGGKGIGIEDVLTGVCVLALAAAGLLGQYLLQFAYRGGEAGSVVAALTVVDPIVSVTMGIVALGEAHAATWWTFALFGVGGAAAVLGVIRLARSRGTNHA